MTVRTSLKAAALIVLVSAATASQAQWPFNTQGAERPTLAPLLKEVTPAVVNISVVTQSRVSTNPLFEDPFFRRFFDVPQQPRSVPQQSAGSGVIIDADAGYVLTNHHVVANADEILVTLADRRSFAAQLIGSDEGTDIALLRIDAEGLTAIEVGDSDSLEVGDFVVAIGNPFGLGQTVTSGIVSALGRSGLNVEGYEDFIQTDASINPGNSGGALVDLDGRLVGVNTAIIAPAGGNVGIGFAVPTNMAREVMDQLLEYGEVRRGRLGVTIQDVTPELADALGLDVREGAVVTQVEPSSAAARAGLEPGDVIVEFNGEPVEGSSDLRNKVGLARLGSEVEIVYVRDGRRDDVRATIGEAEAASLAGTGNIQKLEGAEFRNLDPTHPRYGIVDGVLIVQVDPGSPAARNGLRAGDIVTAVNRTRIGDVRGLADAVRRASGAFALNIVRGDSRLFVVIQ